MISLADMLCYALFYGYVLLLNFVLLGFFTSCFVGLYCTKTLAHCVLCYLYFQILLIMKKKLFTLIKCQYNITNTIKKTTNFIAFWWQFIKFIQAYMTEARWLNNNYKPTLKEYICVSIQSSGYALLTTTCYIGMGDTITEDIFKWVSNEPKIINAAIVLCRLMNDIVSNEVYI